MLYAAAAQFTAQYACKWAATGKGEVGYTQLLGVEFVPGAERGDYGDAALFGGDNQVQLAANEVDAVSYLVAVSGQHLLTGFGAVESG